MIKFKLTVEKLIIKLLYSKKALKLNCKGELCVFYTQQA